MPLGRHRDGLGDAGGGGAASGVVDVSRLQHFDDSFLNKNRPPHPPQRREARAAAAVAVAAVHSGNNNSFGRQQQHEPLSSRLSWAKVHWAPRKRTSRLITTAAGGMSQQQTTQLSSWAKVHWTPRRRTSRQQQLQQRLPPTSTSPPGRTSRLTTAATFDSGDAAGVAQRPRRNSWAKVHWQPQRHTSWSGRERRPPVVATVTHRVARTARLTTWAKCQWSPDQPSRSAVVSPGSSRRHASSSSTTLRGVAGAGAGAAAGGGGTLARFAVTLPPQAPPRAQAIVSTPSLGGDRRPYYDPPGGGRRPLNTARPAVAAATVGSTGPKDLSGAPVEVRFGCIEWRRVYRLFYGLDTAVLACRLCR